MDVMSEVLVPKDYGAKDYGAEENRRKPESGHCRASTSTN